MVVLIIVFLGIFIYFNATVYLLQEYTPEEFLARIDAVKNNWSYWHEQSIQADANYQNSLRFTDTNVQQECLNARNDCVRNANQEARMVNILQSNYDKGIYSDEAQSVLGKRGSDGTQSGLGKRSRD